MRTYGPLLIRASALVTARVFFEEQGARGFEGTALLAGTPSEGVTHCVIPEQRPYGNGEGIGVEVTETGKLELASALTLDELYLARIHSHPGEAFHSYVDNHNPGLTAEGSLSIVVPYYGLGLRRGLEVCALFAYTQGHWTEVPATCIGEYAEVV